MSMLLQMLAQRQAGPYRNPWGKKGHHAQAAPGPPPRVSCRTQTCNHDRLHNEKGIIGSDFAATLQAAHTAIAQRFAIADWKNLQ
jgi:hypothetical protein